MSYGSYNMYSVAPKLTTALQRAPPLQVQINVGAVIHLSRLFLPHLRTMQRAAIMNVTSGLSFVPRVRRNGCAGNSPGIPTQGCLAWRR